MSEPDADELIDAHLDREELTVEQAERLAAWLKQDSSHADAAFRRIFLHTYLRQLAVSGAVPQGATLPIREDSPLLLDASRDQNTSSGLSLFPPGAGVSRKPFAQHKRVWASGGLFAILTAALLLGLWWNQTPVPTVYEGFEYPRSLRIQDPTAALRWPTTGGLEGLAGGSGWAEGWQENGSRVGIVADSSIAARLEKLTEQAQNTPTRGAYAWIVKSRGGMLQTPPEGESKTSRRLSQLAFSAAVRDEAGLGRDDSEIWLSFLASAVSRPDRVSAAYLQLGSDAAGLRIGLLDSRQSPHWSVAGVSKNILLYVRQSGVSTAEPTAIVMRIRFLDGAERVTAWINPAVDRYPADAETTLQLSVPDFRFTHVSLIGRTSSTWDEIRIGESFWSVVP